MDFTFTLFHGLHFNVPRFQSFEPGRITDLRLIVIMIVVMSVSNLEKVCATDINYRPREGESRYLTQKQSSNGQTRYKYFTDPLQVSRIGSSAEEGNDANRFYSRAQSHYQITNRQEGEPTGQGIEPEIEQTQEGENGNSEEEMKSPLEDVFDEITEPGRLLPIINNLTFIALVLLHLPAAVPAVLVPLSFFCVGALLIPIVRVNYFLTHKDDGEDGRSLGSSWAIGTGLYSWIISQIS